MAPEPGHTSGVQCNTLSQKAMRPWTRPQRALPDHLWKSALCSEVVIQDAAECLFRGRCSPLALPADEAAMCYVQAMEKCAWLSH